jgi:simple sugar transport system substrate-binding protein
MTHNKIITALGLWAVSATCAYATTVLKNPLMIYK